MDSGVIIAIIISILFILCSGIVIAICYFKHLCCFEHKWKVKGDETDKFKLCKKLEDEDADTLNLSDPKIMYEGQKGADKKKQINVSTRYIPEIKAISHEKMPEALRAKSLSKDTSADIVKTKSEVITSPTIIEVNSVGYGGGGKHKPDVSGSTLQRPPRSLATQKMNVSVAYLPNLPAVGMNPDSIRVSKKKSNINRPDGGKLTDKPTDSIYVDNDAGRESGLASLAPNAVSSHGYQSSDAMSRGNSLRSSGKASNVKDYYAVLPTTSSGTETSPDVLMEMQEDAEYDDVGIVDVMPVTPDSPVKKSGFAQLEDDIKEATSSNRVYEFKHFQSELQLLKIIGEGSFGKVYKARWDSNDVAVKIFTNVGNQSMNTNNVKMTSSMVSTQSNVSQLSGGGINIEMGSIQSLDDEVYKELYAEIILATSIPYHPNIVRIMGFCRNPISVIMEYMPGGSVQKLVYGLTKRKEPSVSEKLVILIKSCGGLKELTKHNLHHRDVAARNILLGEYENKITQSTRVCITDFGMTRKENESTANKTKQDGGPYKWMAPESIQKQEYNEKTDVYMFAITMWEIMYGKEPYETDDAINAAMKAVMNNERPEFLWDLPTGLKTLIKKCWDKDPDQRWTFKEISKKLQKIKNGHDQDTQEQNAMDEQVENQTTIGSIQ